MVKDHREFFTSDGVQAMKWGLAREAVARDIQQAVFAHEPPVCFRGNENDGYYISYDHDKLVHDQEDKPDHGDLPESVTHYWLPPFSATPGDTNGQVYLEDYQGNRTTTSMDVWSEPGPPGAFEISGFYRRWANRVDRAFEGWDKVDEIPDEREFWDAAGRIRDAIRPLESLTESGESYYAACQALGLVGQPRLWAPQINGPVDAFVIPLQGTILNLLVLGEMLAAQLDGMGDMWQHARASIMDIGWNATKAMADHKAGIDVGVVIKGGGWVFGALGLITMPATAALGVAIGSLLLAGAQEIVDATRGKGPVDRESSLGGRTAEDVMRAVEKVLNVDEQNGLEPLIQDDESKAMDLLQTTRENLKNELVYDPATKSYKTWYALSAHNILADSPQSQPADVDIDAEFQRLRTAGTVLADELAKELGSVARGIEGYFSTNEAWLRPQVPGSPTGIGMGRSGPWEDWHTLRDEMVAILNRTAAQAEGVGDYFIATANYLERADAEAKAAFDKASQDLGRLFG